MKGNVEEEVTWSEKKNEINSFSPQDIIEPFIIWTRRVEAHSLVKNGDTERYVDPKITVGVSETGDVNIQYYVCADEEVGADRGTPISVP